VISIIALIVALGGTSYAAVKVNGKDIKKGTVSGAALKKNTLGGTQINESKIGKVPSAVVADSAGTAADAAKLGGLSASGFAKGNANVFAHNVTIAAGTGVAETIIQVPGVGHLEGTCYPGSQLAITGRSDSENLSIVISNTPTATTIASASGVYDAGFGAGLTSADKQQIKMSMWRASDPNVAYEIDGSSIGCSAGAVAIGHG
jgi:hypothetical protein